MEPHKGQLPMECTALIKVGEVAHVITRRKFETEPRRHFVGRIMAADALNVRLQGYAFVFDTTQAGMYFRHEQERTRVLNLAESGLIVNLLSPEVVVEEVRYELDSDERLVVTDGKNFTLAVHEFGMRR